MRDAKKKRISTSVAAILVAAASVAQIAVAQATAPRRPQLVVGILVEGLNDDYLRLLRDHFTDGGFRRLMAEGVTINALDYGAPLDGAASAAVVFTGAEPYVSGIPASKVFDSSTRRARSVLFDAETIGNYTSETLSPKNLAVSTLADELRIDTGGLGYAYAIAAEPEQAVIMAGHAGNSAFWVTDDTGKWATTTHYKDLPAPPQNINHRAALEYRLDTLAWTPVVPTDKLPDLPSYKKLYPFRQIFPRGNANRFKAYKASPMANADITALAEEYIKTLTLGRREATDMLSLGYTLNPYNYGREADSRAELMDGYLRLDRDLSALFATIERQGPGMDKTLVFLAGTPAARRQRRDDDRWNLPGGEFSSRKAVSLLNMYLMALHGNGDWVDGYHDGQLYLNRKLIKERDKDLEALRKEAARFLTRMSGVREAWTIDEILDNTAGGNAEALRRNIALPVAGDVFVTIAPGWQELDDDNDTERPVTTVRSVLPTAPAFILAPGVAPREIDTPVDARALAPSVAGILRIRAPNAAATPRLKL
ncbi:MAG: alkaline phosphatase family protein [[Clostridium] fimetarium]|nr:alkaline phosphatase family protein [Alistipes timonensis]MCM1406839.1 alkaline phosphatase family protein [[Clostridium] fimetarium]